METPFESKYEKYVVHLIGHKSCYNLFNIFKIIIGTPKNILDISFSYILFANKN